MLEPYLTISGFLWVITIGAFVLCSKAAILMWALEYLSERPHLIGGTVMPKLSFQACVVVCVLGTALF